VTNGDPTAPVVNLNVGLAATTNMMLTYSTGGALSWKSSIGYNQTWGYSGKGGTGGAAYTNSKSMPILAFISITNTIPESVLTSTFKINGLVIAYIGCPVIYTYLNASFIIPPNNTYQLSLAFGHELKTWAELS